jgi:gamma-glutamyl:cysteine ligase YbdK (ATP-grasp superfamily)
MPNYPLFSVMGIEIEYMLVDAQHLNVAPQSDKILQDLAGTMVNEYALGPISVSNELVLHVLELKNHPPVAASTDLISFFQNTLNTLYATLDKHQLTLLPTAAHPWMNPLTETQRWPHGNREIYQKYDEIFNCEGHGWSNLQSMHINLPFNSNASFVQLHNAIRLILPLLPALAASSPILEKQSTGTLDRRLSYYNRNQAMIPEIAGKIIPEFVSSIEDYHHLILHPMYEAIKPYDPEGVLQYEWLNSRGAIPKFDYHAIEIRVVDTQESVLADLSIARAVHEILKHWTQHPERYLQNPYPTEALSHVYQQAIETGFDTTVDDPELLRQWGLSCQAPISLREVWSLLLQSYGQNLPQDNLEHLNYILTHGNLSERILKTQPNSHQKMLDTYHTLAQCLKFNQRF